MVFEQNLVSGLIAIRSSGGRHLCDYIGSAVCAILDGMQSMCSFLTKMLLQKLLFSHFLLDLHSWQHCHNLHCHNLYDTVMESKIWIIRIGCVQTNVLDDKLHRKVKRNCIVLTSLLLNLEYPRNSIPITSLLMPKVSIHTKGFTIYDTCVHTKAAAP